LILKKISKIDATRCQILRRKCTKIDFGWGSAPDPAGGANSAPPGPLAVFKGPTSKGKEGKGKRGGKGEGKGRGGENDLTHPLSRIPGYATGSRPRSRYFIYMINFCKTFSFPAFYHTILVQAIQFSYSFY